MTNLSVRMKKETLDKLRRYIDLAAAPAALDSPLVSWAKRYDDRERAWQEFIDAVLAEEYVPDDARLDQALVDLMERGAAS